ncbi:MAG: cell wall-binding repeat-containing protein, partial [Ornithinimicrobium sp.]
TQLRSYATSGSVQRVSGGNQYEVAANLAGYYPRGVDVLYVATGRDYPDALAGAGRAGTLEGPVVYVGQRTLPRATKEAITKLNPDRVVVLGGGEAIPSTVLREVQALVD